MSQARSSTSFQADRASRRRDAPLAGWLREGRMPEPGQRRGAGRLADAARRSPEPRREKRSRWSACFSPASRCWRTATSSRRTLGVHVFSRRTKPTSEREADPPDAASQSQATRAGRRGISSQDFTMLMPEVRPEPRGVSGLPGRAGPLPPGRHGAPDQPLPMAGRQDSRRPCSRLPLQEIVRRPRLLWAVHLVYFGLFVVGSLIIYRIAGPAHGDDERGSGPDRRQGKRRRWPSRAGPTAPATCSTRLR